MLAGDSQIVPKEKDLLVREEEHLQGDLDRDNSEKHFKPTHDFERPVESLDFALVLFDELGGEDVGPELRQRENLSGILKGCHG